MFCRSDERWRQNGEMDVVMGAKKFGPMITMISSHSATLMEDIANAFHDEKFIRQEVRQMCDWLKSCVEGAARKAIASVRTTRSAEAIKDEHLNKY